MRTDCATRKASPQAYDAIRDARADGAGRNGGRTAEARAGGHIYNGFREIQKLYAVIGAAFIPLLALLLLILNGRVAWVGADMKNRWPTLAGLIATLGFFGWVAWTKWAG